MSEEKSLKEVILEELKSEGLDVAEDAAAGAARASLRILKVVVEKSENKVDDMLLPLFALVEPKVMELIDKIDGEDDPGR